MKVKWIFAVVAGEPMNGRTAAGIPRGYWNFSWVAEDDLSLRNDTRLQSGESDFVSSPQTGRQTKEPTSSTFFMLTIGHDNQQISISLA